MKAHKNICICSTRSNIFAIAPHIIIYLASSHLGYLHLFRDFQTGEVNSVREIDIITAVVNDVMMLFLFYFFGSRNYNRAWSVTWVFNKWVANIRCARFDFFSVYFSGGLCFYVYPVESLGFWLSMYPVCFWQRLPGLQKLLIENLR